MKKIWRILVVVGLFFILAACGQSTTTKQADSPQKQTATIILKEEGKEVEKKELPFKKNESLLTIMETNFSVKVEKDFVTGIDAYQQDPSQNKYWLHDVNGKQPDVGAAEYFLKDGDIVTWSLDKV